MPTYNDITIQRSDLDSLEGSTLRNYNYTITSECVLGLSDTDKFMLDSAKRDVKIDLSSRISHLVEDGTYLTITEALDAISGVDNDNLIRQLISLKFLEKFFGDQATSPEDLSFRKAEIYHSEYYRSFAGAVKILLSNLNPPRNSRTIRLVRY